MQGVDSYFSKFHLIPCMAKQEIQKAVFRKDGTTSSQDSSQEEAEVKCKGYLEKRDEVGREDRLWPNCKITHQQNSTTPSRRQLHPFPSFNSSWEGLFGCLADELKPKLPSSHSSACWALLWAISLLPMFLRRLGIPSARSSPWGRGLAPAPAPAAATFCWCSSSAARRR